MTTTNSLTLDLPLVGPGGCNKNAAVGLCRIDSSKYNSKRDYERNDRVSNYRDRDISPGSGSVSLNNGNSYRSQSPEIDSPSSRGHGGSHDIRDRNDHRGGGGGGGGGGDRYSYIQKMRDRDRDLYKKDKYSDKRDRRGNDRDSESHRSTNHDRGDRRGGLSSKFSSSNDKRSGSDDRDRERDRDRDLRDLRDKRDHRGGSDERKRDRERDLRDSERRRGGLSSSSGAGAGSAAGNAAVDEKRSGGGGGGGGDRGERVARYGDWSEHVSSSGKMYYYNCKTEVSQWEKPKEWIERERNLARDQHREKDYREKERDRERDDRFSRSAYSKHSSSRGNARLRWNYDNDGRPPTHRRRLDGRLGDNVDMDISPGDSTPTSEASYSLGGTPTTHGAGGGVSSQQHNNSEQSSTATGNSTQSGGGGTTVGLPNALPRLASHPNANSLGTTNANCANSPATANAAGGGGGGGMPPTMLPTTGLASVTAANPVITTNNNHRKLDGVALMQHQTHLAQATAASPNASVPALTNQGDHHLNSNAPGPPKLGGGGHKDSVQQQQQHHQHARLSHQNSQQHLMDSAHTALEATNHAIRENALNSPLYNLTHSHGMSPLHYTRSPLTTGGGGHVNSGVPNANYSCNTTNFAHKTVENSSGGGGVGLSSNCNSNSNSNSHSNNNGQSIISPSTCSSLTHTTQTLANSSNAGMLPGEGPPTPTQELDTSGTSIDQQQQRKMDGSTSATLSSLQSCVSSSVQAGRLQGPEISPKLAKYFRSDLIQHVTNWQADILEAQCQKLSEEAHLYGDLQCTKVSAELKCARSLVRITEITATLQEQRIMYLRQQIRRLEESKSQNSFMSDDL